MKRPALAVLLPLMVWSTVTHAALRAVIVLVPSRLGTEQWPEGTSAVIAELSADGFEVVQNQSEATTSGTLLAEVARTAAHDSVLGVIAVLREGENGAAYVWTAHGERVLRDDTPGARGAVAESAVALRVVELLRTEMLQFPLAAPARSKPTPQNQTLLPRRPAGLIWLGATTSFGSDSGTPPLAIGAGASVRLVLPFGLDIGGMAGLMPAHIETRAGRLSMRTEEFGARLMFDPYPSSSVTFALGLGVSSLWFQADADGARGFAGKRDATQVMLLAARARLAVRMNRFLGLLVFDPGLTSPTVTVKASGTEVLRLGRPFVTIMTGAGWAF